jgi:hypothetical protein
MILLQLCFHSIGGRDRLLTGATKSYNLQESVEIVYDVVDVVSVARLFPRLFISVTR